MLEVRQPTRFTHELQENSESDFRMVPVADSRVQFSTAVGRGAVSLSPTASVLMPIDEVPLGARVATKNPRADDYDNSFGEPDEASWIRVTLAVSKRNGLQIDSELLRPRDWVESQQLSIGSQIPILNEELEVNGLARVMALEACPPLADGDGEVVTGRFVTRRVDTTVCLTFSNNETLEGTAVHPIWSPERDAWVPMGEFALGDAVLSGDDRITIRSIEFRYRTVPVYNLEVHSEHVYEVTASQILVHNVGAGVGDCSGDAPENKKSYQTYTKLNGDTGEIYSGRTSGGGTPAQNIARRDSSHHMNEKGFGPAELDKSSTNPNAIRGREQQLIDQNGGAKSGGGTSGNQNNGISIRNKKGQTYIDAANREFCT